jgi:hypothetical protein
MVSSRMSKCLHHWVIDRPNGPTSVGVCKYCGKHGEFRNSLDNSPWIGFGPNRRNKKKK